VERNLARGHTEQRTILKISTIFIRKKIVVKEIKVREPEICQEEKEIEIGHYEGRPRRIKAFFCKGDLKLSEYYIGLAASELSENFIQTYVYKECDNSDAFIFMEKIDTTLMKYITDIEHQQRMVHQEFDAVVVQMLHALWLLHKAGINHNDPKSDNIFLKKSDGYVTKDGSKLSDYDYVEFDFDSMKIRVPVKYMKYVVKIGDYGISQKYSEPAIITEVIEYGFIVDYLSPFYDIMLAFSRMSDDTTPLFKTIQTFILGFGESINMVDEKFDIDEIRTRWGDISCICDKTCTKVQTVENVIKNEDNYEDFIENHFSKFARCIFYNPSEANRDRRQNYNFKLSQMKDKNIDVPRIITTSFFQSQMQKYGWLSDDASGRILSFV